MAKRFTATEKWLDPWFCNLSLVDRLFWLYLLDNCDHAGIWQVNEMLVKTYFPGYKIDPIAFGDRIQVVSPEKWFITKFNTFQYGNLNPDNRLHQSILTKLEKEGLYKVSIGTLLGPKDKDKDMDKDKETSYHPKKFVKPTPGDVTTYAKSIGFDLNGSSFCDYYESRGWVVGRSPMKDWKAAVRTWKTNNLSPAIKTEVPAWMK